jgi:hypothetical protein
MLNAFAIFACGLQILALVMTILLAPGSIFNKNRYLTYLIVCELGILLWLPFRNYSIENVNSLFFSYDFRGALVGSNLIAMTMISIQFLLTIRIVNKNATKKHKPTLYLLLGVSLCLTFLISLFGIPAIDRLFGISSTNSLAPWFSGIVFLVPLFCLLVFWIDLHVGDE